MFFVVVVVVVTKQTHVIFMPILKMRKLRLRELLSQLSTIIELTCCGAKIGTPIS